MKNLDEFRNAGEDIYGKLHLATYPVAITYIREEGEIPQKRQIFFRSMKSVTSCFI
jgi:uncharacterized protein (DUF169 family)